MTDLQIPFPGVNIDRLVKSDFPSPAPFFNANRYGDIR